MLSESTARLDKSAEVARQILVVHRDPARRQTISHCLQRAETQMAVYECEGAFDTREVLRTAQPSCVLVELDLLGGSCWDLMDEWRNLPFIVLTKSGREGPEALRRGAQDHIVETNLDPIVLDRSIQYAMERKLHGRAMENLAHQDRLASLGQLSATVAHEINNPLSYIAANLETLQQQINGSESLLQALLENPASRSVIEAHLARDPLPLSLEETRAIVGESATGCQRIVSIVRQLGSFARKSSDDERPSRTCLSDVVKWACVLTRGRVEQRGALVTRLDDESVFVGRPGRLAQVATNLLINAAQALPPGERKQNTVWVTTHADAEASYLVVEDTGPGFDWATSRRALDPFFTTKPQGEGTGLGLSIADDIVRAHGGSIELGNRPEGGARVVVRIPHRGGLRLRSSAPPRPTAEAQQFRILLIDDEEPLRRAYRRWLRPHHVVAEGATDALARLFDDGDRNFDLVLCDLTMPDVSGLEVRERITREAPELVDRFVFLTGGVASEESRDALERLAVPVLSKPPTKDQILAAARAARARV